jgi:hypothetical protein
MQLINLPYLSAKYPIGNAVTKPDIPIIASTYPTYSWLPVISYK